mgnify:CR=1 FL=1
MFASPAVHTPDRHGPPMPYMGFIKNLQSAINGLPLMALGRITDPAEADGILARGEAQLIGMGRTWDIRYCLSCNTCWGTVVTQQVTVACVNNPRVALPDEVNFWPEPAVAKRRVVVIGAGLAGMEAAWTAATRGHAVTVFGASDDTGGKARLRESCRVARRSPQSMTIRR